MAYIFLDESGDLGFAKNSSQYFIITILAVEDRKQIEKIVRKIHAQLRQKVKRLSGGILHAFKEKPVTRKRMLLLLEDSDCSSMIIILNKARVHTNLKDEKHVLYNYVTNILLDRIMTKKLIKTNSPIHMIVAKRETNRFLNENFKQYLKKQTLNRHKLELNIEIKRPFEEKALQAVDFISWACFRKYELKDEEYCKILSKTLVEENMLFK